MDLYLVRHAIAENRDPGRWPDDAARPLTIAGEARFRDAARGLTAIARAVEVVWSSPYARAWRTAEILHEEAGWPAPEPCPQLEAIRGPEDALGALRQLHDYSRVALVGHEPTLSELASRLLTGDAGALRIEFKKGAVMLIAFPAAPDPGQGLLRLALSPKLLRALAPAPPG
jgi:phosphohistidine phosphatase